MANAVCDVCGQRMTPNSACIPRLPLRDTRHAVGPIRVGEPCNDCNAADGKPHHSTCAFLWCDRHEVQYLLCRKEHDQALN